MNAPASLSDVQAAMSLLHHIYFNPILRVLVRHRVPDHLDHGPLSASDLAQRADAECIAILRRCREAMRPTDRLLVAEMLTVPCKPSVQVSLIDMIMLMYFGEARQRTVDEYRGLFDSTHFSLTRVLPTAGAFSIVEAAPVR
jgi:O-methyltransferase domain